MTDPAGDSQRLKHEQQEAWDDNAAGWRKWWPVFERAGQSVSSRIVELAAVRPGHRVLDLATGNGEPAATAARVVGPSGRVVAVDQSAGMLAIARERAAALGLGNMEFVESDAESLVFNPASFEAVVCRWGLMFMPDLDATCAALRAVLKPGGRFATAVWAAAPKVPMITLAAEQIRAITGAKPPPPGALQPLRLADTSILTRALTAAGLRNIREERMNVRFEFGSVTDFIAFRAGVGASRAMMEKLPPETRARVVAAIGDAARSFTGADGVVRFDNETILVAATA
jgi:enediyne biosynthesis protein CalE5